MIELGLIQMSVMWGIIVAIIYFILSWKWKDLLKIREIIFSPRLQISIFLGVIIALGMYFFNIGIERNYTSSEVATLVALLAIMLISLKPNEQFK